MGGKREVGETEWRQEGGRGRKEGERGRDGDRLRGRAGDTDYTMYVVKSNNFYSRGAKSSSSHIQALDWHYQSARSSGVFIHNPVCWLLFTV